MKTFLEWLDSVDVVNESYEKENRELAKMMKDAGFTYLGKAKSNENVWEKDGAKISVTGKPKSPKFIFGKAMTEHKKEKMRIEEMKKCKTCNGSGKLDDKTCSACEGTGKNK